jgi:hypothetical protein
MEPSGGGIFTMRSLLFIPSPQVALQESHSPHSVTRQLLGAKERERGDQTVKRGKGREGEGKRRRE